MMNTNKNHLENLSEMKTEENKNSLGPIEQKIDHLVAKVDENRYLLLEIAFLENKTQELLEMLITSKKKRSEEFRKTKSEQMKAYHKRKKELEQKLAPKVDLDDPTREKFIKFAF